MFSRVSRLGCGNVGEPNHISSLLYLAPCYMHNNLMGFGETVYPQLLVESLDILSPRTPEQW